MDGVVEVAEIFVDVRTFCLSRTVQARRKVRGSEVPVRPEGPGAGMSGLDRKFRWSGFFQELGLGDRGFGRKNLGEKPKSEGEKEEIGGNEGGEARSTSHTQTSRIKTNKISIHEQIRKKIGAIFGGDFRIRMKNNKIRLETQRGGSEIVINLAHDTKMM